METQPIVAKYIIVLIYILSSTCFEIYLTVFVNCIQLLSLLEFAV